MMEMIQTECAQLEEQDPWVYELLLLKERQLTIQLSST